MITSDVRRVSDAFGRDFQVFSKDFFSCGKNCKTASTRVRHVLTVKNRKGDWSKQTRVVSQHPHNELGGEFFEKLAREKVGDKSRQAQATSHP